MGGFIMKFLLAFLTFSSAALALDTYTETRDVTDAAGNSFSCTYSLVYDSNSAKVYRQQSGVACEPNVNGKQTIEDVVIEAINRTATVTYTVKQDKTGISKIALADYIAPTTAAEIDGLMWKAGAYKAASALTLDEAMVSNPPSKDPADSGSIKCPLIPSIFSRCG